MSGPYREPAQGGAVVTERLRLHSTSDVLGVAPGSVTEIFAVLRLEASGERLDAARARFVVSFVLDVSGSMTGEPLHQVCDSVVKLVDLLDPTDSAGVVVFSDNPATVAPLAPLDPATKATLKRRVNGLVTSGGTGLSAGVDAGRNLLPARRDGERQVLVVLTDGAPTDGTTPAALGEKARSYRPDVSVVALGYGPNHNAEMLRAFADGGGGQYWYIADPAQANVELARAIGSQGDIVVDGVQLVMLPAEGVEIVEVFGEARLRIAADGVRVPLPDLRDGERRAVVVRLAVRAPREAGRAKLLDVAVEHRHAGQTTVRRVPGEVSIDVTHRAENLIDVPARTLVALARAEQVRKAARAHCDQHRFDAAATLLRAMIAELEAIPGYKKADGSELSEAVEQLIDEAVMCEQRPSATAYNEYRAATMGIDVAQGSRHPADYKAKSVLSKDTLSAMIDEDVEGEVVVMIAGVEKRVPLAPEVTIGRSVDNDVVVQNATVTRRHARILCRFGKVFVVDLGSTSGTFVNGQQARQSEVTGADEIRIGDAKVRVFRRK